MTDWTGRWIAFMRDRNVVYSAVAYQYLRNGILRLVTSTAGECVEENVLEWRPSKEKKS